MEPMIICVCDVAYVLKVPFLVDLMNTLLPCGPYDITRSGPYLASSCGPYECIGHCGPYEHAWSLWTLWFVEPVMHSRSVVPQIYSTTNSTIFYIKNSQIVPRFNSVAQCCFTNLLYHK